MDSVLKAKADELADWFGREGDLRAEVVEIDPAPPSDGQYEILMVSRAARGSATIERADYQPRNLEEAQAWASTFNNRELCDPIGQWAVVNRVVEAA